MLRYFTGFDIVVVEGHKMQSPNKVEVFRRGAGHDQPLCPPGEALATVTDTEISRDPQFGLDDAPALRAVPRRAPTAASEILKRTISREVGAPSTHR